MIDRFEKFTFVIDEISNYWNKIASDEMKKYELKGPYALYLTTLYNHPEGITATRLCEICHKDKSEVSRAVSCMIGKGIVERVEVNNNAYRALLKLTETGKVSAEHIRSRANLAVELGGMGMSDEQRSIFYDSLDLIASNLRKISKEGLPENEYKQHS